MAIEISTFRYAKSLIHNESGVLVDHKGKGDNTPARDFFTAAGCPQAFIDFVLDETNQWRDFCAEEIDLTHAGIKELDDFLKKCLDAPYGLANGSLDQMYSNGFNRHDTKHISKVTKNVRHLLKQAGEKKDVRRRAVLAARGHDLGNILSRNLHSLVSPYILARVIEAVLPDESLDITDKKRVKQAKNWRTIRRAIQLHNEPVASALIQSFCTESEESGNGELCEQAIIEKMRERFGPEALALIIADKTDIGQHRISEKAKGQEAVDTDPHLAVNLLGKTRDIGLSADKKTFVWNLDFTPGKAKDERFAVPSTVRGKSRRSYVPEFWHTLHTEHNYSHFLSWDASFWSLYYDRIILTVRSAFALYPSIDEFKIVVTDIDDKAKHERVFERKGLEKQFMFTMLKNAPKDKRRMRN